MNRILPLPIRARAVAGIVLLALTVFWAAPRALAQANSNPPERLTFQGFLADGNGEPLGNTGPKNYDVIFRIMGAQTGGTAVWTEQQTVVVDAGNFSVLFGEGTTVGSEARPALSSLFATNTASDRFVEITVKGIGTAGADVTILPRLRLLTSPYAFLARNAINAVSAATLVNSAGAPLITSSGNAVTVGGSLAANSFSGTFSGSVAGNGSGLTSLNAANVASGTLADGRLSANVALLNASQTFTGTNRFSQGLSLGSSTPMGKLEIQAGANQDGTSDGKAIALAWHAGGFRHFIRSRHANGATSGNGIDFFVNTSQGDSSSAPGTGNTNVLTLAGNGNVGIGTANPTAKLVVQGDAGVNTHQLVIQSASAPGKQLLLGFNTTNNYGIIQPLEQGVDYRNLCLNPSGGNVGIATFTPTKGRLEVGLPANNTSYSGFGFLNRNGAGSSGSSVSRAVSIYAEGVIVTGGEFNALSDGRVKNIQGRSDGSADLATLKRIEVTDYTHKDVIAKGNGPQKKVIAQQVEKVFPQAVSQHTNVVPDIYQKAEVKDGWVKLATNLKKGERVRLIGDRNQGVHEVLEVKQDRFRTDFAADGDTVFVYGREVNDFRAVDYDAIAMLNVSATQELARKLAAQESELAELRAEVEKLRGERKSLARSVSDLSARDQAWEARFTKLERALAPGAEPQGASQISARARAQSVNALAQ